MRIYVTRCQATMWLSASASEITGEQMVKIVKALFQVL